MSYGGISRGPITQEQIDNNERFERDYRVGYGVMDGLMHISCRECHAWWPYPEHKPECSIGKHETPIPS